ncbi:MAG: extracellular solute-binding protein [Candidatus Pristimantibacillus lignocellulolyticus]|uniref:Extracellular solute-binding protein n=1 Tax=Candidatus Pristimantibacillus lignocellulolyticus TaxID=2994561 RepID=A0A9J6ZGV6_9BACL|nr:MAG: extracellular solute-binding protein [Candidatus Pristimantibacillus lignocellulolyticus]
MKKLSFNLTIMFVLLALVISGCSSNNGSTNGNAQQNEGASATSETDNTEPAWKSDTSPVSLSWYTGVSGYSKKWDAKNNFVDKIITEETGVSVDFIHAGNDVNAEFNVMMATGNLPDVITLDRWNSTSLVQTLINSDMVAPMNELIEQYDPYFSTILPQSMIDWYTQSDGNFYSIPNFYVSPEMLEQYPDVKPDFNDRSNGQILVRADIMDQLGITVEDLQQEDTIIEALKKVKTANIQYNGMTVAPIYFADKDKYIADSLGVLAGSFGAVSEAEDGSYVDSRTTSEYKHMLQFVNRLSRENLLSLENFTSARNQIEEKLTQGAVFMKIGSIADYSGPVTQLAIADENAKYITIDAIKSNDGSLPQYGRALNKGWTLTFINKNSKNKERAIEFIDYMYSEHGQTVNQFGKEGETFTITADGKYMINEDIQAEMNADWNAAGKKWGLDSIWWFTNDVWLKHVKDENLTELTEYVDSLHYGSSKYMFSNAELDSGNLFDAYEPGSKEANAESKINVFWAQIVPKMMFSKTDDEFEKHYKEAMDTIDKLGLESIEAARNVRVQEFKQATGATLISPKYTGQY